MLINFAKKISDSGISNYLHGFLNTTQSENAKIKGAKKFRSSLTSSYDQ